MGKTRLTVVISDLGFGGAQNMVCEQLKYTNMECYDVSVVVLGFRKGTTIAQKLETVLPIAYANHCGRVTPVTIYKMLRLIQKTKPDVVHAHIGGVGFAAMWAKLFRKPLVITAHTKPEKAFTAKVEKQVRAALMAGRTKLVAVSEDNANKLRKYFALDNKLCGCVNNGIDLDRFNRKSHEGFTVIHVGRQDENKNQAALIRCFARLHNQYPDTKLLLLGDGDQHEKLIDLAERLNITDAVKFTGNVSDTEDYYAVSDLYVQCSHREAMPLSVLEAMATGLPIISTDVGGLSDVVRDNGILVQDNDEEALYSAILKIYEQSEEERKRMSNSSLEIVKDYSSEEMARKYEEIYQEMLWKM